MSPPIDFAKTYADNYFKPDTENGCTKNAAEGTQALRDVSFNGMATLCFIFENLENLYRI